MIATAALITAGIAFTLFLWLQLSAPEELIGLISSTFKLRQLILSAVLMNAAAIGYIIYFFFKIGSPDGFWLFCAFVGVGLLGGGSMDLAFGIHPEVPVLGVAEISFGSSWQQQVGISTIGAIFAYNSGRRYEKARKKAGK